MFQRLNTEICVAFAMVLFCASSASAQWVEQLPNDIQKSILWSADHEEGDLDDWAFYNFEYAGGGVFNTGGLEVQAVVEFGIAHSGVYSARASITNAYRSLNGDRAVRLMRWTDRPWDDEGFYFPGEAYYSTWMYFPKTYNPNKYAPWDPGDGGWWTVFQFSANDELGESTEVWSLGVDHDDNTGEMSFNLYSLENKPSSYRQPKPLKIPVGQWVHVEVYYRPSSEQGGQVTVWQDGQQILDADNVKTALTPKEEYAIWALGNFTDHIVGDKEDGAATLYFDDSIISKKRTSALPAPARK